MNAKHWCARTVEGLAVVLVITAVAAMTVVEWRVIQMVCDWLGW